MIDWAVSCARIVIEATQRFVASEAHDDDEDDGTSKICVIYFVWRHQHDHNVHWSVCNDYKDVRTAGHYLAAKNNCDVIKLTCQTLPPPYEAHKTLGMSRSSKKRVYFQRPIDDLKEWSFDMMRTQKKRVDLELLASVGVFRYRKYRATLPREYFGPTDHEHEINGKHNSQTEQDFHQASEPNPNDAVLWLVFFANIHCGLAIKLCKFSNDDISFYQIQQISV